MSTLLKVKIYVSMYSSYCKLNSKSLFEAVERGDLKSAESLMKRFGKNFGYYQYQSYMLLCEAMESRKLAAARFLLDKGAAVNTDTNNRKPSPFFKTYNETPLQLAVIHEDVELCKIILSRGGSVNDYGGKDGETALHMAVRLNLLEVVKLLLEHKSDINRLDGYDRTPLLTSIEAGTDSLAMLQLLFEYQPDLTIRRGNLGYSELATMKIIWNHSEILEINVMDALLYATLFKRTDTIIYLLEHGADINSIDGYGRTPLVVASIMGDEDLCRLFIDRGCDINKSNDECGATPLHHACAHGNDKVVKLLLASGSDYNANPIGWTPLHQICYTRFRHKPCYKAIHELLDYGVDLNAQIKNCAHRGSKAVKVCITYIMLKSEITPLHVAVATYKQAKKLQYEGNNHIWKYMELLLEYGADVNMLDGEQCSPLYTAVKMKDLGLFNLLIGYGADVSQRCGPGTPLSALSREDSELPFYGSINIYECMYQSAIQWKTLGLATIPEQDMTSIPPSDLSDLKTYEEQCKSELDNISNFNAQLYLLLTKPINDIVHLASNWDIHDLPNKMRPRFPRYYGIMWRRLERIKFRFSLLEECKDFSDWLESALPDCATLILSYLDNGDLRRLSNW